ncbi:bifunctional diaminohydroxyphosphoribosylaminopyrimidine deaminase/5-amino-6-(5-phosphoribosylamino)uracil reductase RibD [Rhizobiaceae bacterium]|nr:bifunctional diaminohydroxyphosphoribosylaminopyrimidine deaminase/5-amino-6-(5-phosphoribosylamino)uracil reductase RibD [Rhizobiaceae bacterium]
MSDAADQRWMAAARRLALWNSGRTGGNPSVGALLVMGGRVVGRGVTADGGRPHAERVALDDAGGAARGATAYVTLEPCAHHGLTPPCAEALRDAGVSRVVFGLGDPDVRVRGAGVAILEAGGVDVNCVSNHAIADDLSAYLVTRREGRAGVTLKLAMSRDGFIGRAGEEVAITGVLARAYGHRMRANHHGILVGRGTVEADDPDLTCRLSGLEGRSPHRFVLGSSLADTSRLAQTAGKVPVTLVGDGEAPPGVARIATGGAFDPRGFLEILAGQGVQSLLVEGGARVAAAFLDAGVVDSLALFVGNRELRRGIRSPLTPDTVPLGFASRRVVRLGDDMLHLFAREGE